MPSEEHADETPRAESVSERGEVGHFDRVQCKNSGCDYECYGYIAPFVFDSGCPECGE